MFLNRYTSSSVYVAPKFDTSKRSDQTVQRAFARPIFRDPWENLRLYFIQAIPRPPAYGFRGLASVDQNEASRPPKILDLNVFPDSKRKLREVIGFRANAEAVKEQAKNVTNFCTKHLPDTPIPDGDALGRFIRYMGLPAASFEIIETEPAYPLVHFLFELMPLVLEPLWVVERAITMVWPDKAWDHTCDLLTDDCQAYPGTKGDVNACRCIVYKKNAGEDFLIEEDDGEELLGPCYTMEVDQGPMYSLPTVERDNAEEDEEFEAPDRRLVIMVTAPWRFTKRDMEIFTDLSKDLPPYNIGRGDQPVYNDYQKLWFKLWDECAARQSPFFVVTNYEYWLFGFFTAGWTRAVVFDIIPLASSNPTVIQWLFFWFASALEIPGGIDRTTKEFQPHENPDSAPPSHPDVTTWVNSVNEHLTQAEWLKKC